MSFFGSLNELKVTFIKTRVFLAWKRHFGIDYIFPMTALWNVISITKYDL